MSSAGNRAIILYDGVCGFCDRFVGMVLRKDKWDRLRFASLQSLVGREMLKKHGLSQSSLDTIYLVVNPGAENEKLLGKSDALIGILKILGGFWTLEAAALRVAPRALRDRLYEGFAQNRYRFFGRYDTCVIPHSRYQKKFLDWDRPPAASQDKIGGQFLPGA